MSRLKGHYFCRTSLPLNASIYHSRCVAKPGGGGLPCDFPNIKKNRNLENVSVCVHIWIKFSIRNAFLRVFRWKKSKIFPDGASYPGF